MIPAVVTVLGVGLVAAVSGLERVVPEREPISRVRLDDDPATRPSPLSPSEAQALRAQADPQRLRCEPRGCERWRLDAADLAGLDAASGVVGLYDDVVLLHARRAAGGDQRDSGDEESTDNRIVAIDATTGQQRWHRTIASERPSDWLRLLPGPQGALVLTSRSVISVDRLGAVAWEWNLAGPDGATLQVWNVAQVSDVLLLEGHRSAAGDHQAFVAALDAATGHLRWAETGLSAAVLGDGIVVLTDDDQQLRRLDAATGATLWHGPSGHPGWLVRDDDWLLARADDRQLVIDVESGRLLSSFVGELMGEPVTVDDGFLGVAADARPPDRGTDPDEESARVRLVLVRGDGSLGWFADLGPQSPWWDCCLVEVDGNVTVTLADRYDEYDLRTGWLVGSEARIDDDVEVVMTPWRTWPATAARPEISWHTDGGGFVVGRDDDEVTIRSNRGLHIASYDPLIVGDGQELLGVRLGGPQS